MRSAGRLPNHVLAYWVITVVLLLVSSLLWLWYPPYNRSDTATVTWKRGGAALVVTINVVDAEGHPAPGTRVATETSSGTTSALTNANGVAIIMPGEKDIVAFYLNDVMLIEWPLLLALDRSEGLEVTITLRKEETRGPGKGPRCLDSR